MAIKRPFCRAKIFQPFDALPGLRELLRAKEREHENAFSPDLADACPGPAVNRKKPLQHQVQSTRAERTTILFSRLEKLHRCLPRATPIRSGQFPRRTDRASGTVSFLMVH